MRWTVKCGDILDEPADVLVCSANVFLNLSGGVGGAILLRFGDAMQRELQDYLARQNRKFAPRGELVTTSPCGTPYMAVLHALAVDGFYKSSPEIVRELVGSSLARAAGFGARTVALAALATGYGRMTMKDFATGIKPLLKTEWLPVAQVSICVRNTADCETLIDLLVDNSTRKSGSCLDGPAEMAYAEVMWVHPSLGWQCTLGGSAHADTVFASVHPLRIAPTLVHSCSGDGPPRDCCRVSSFATVVVLELTYEQAGNMRGVRLQPPR